MKKLKILIVMMLATSIFCSAQTYNYGTNLFTNGDLESWTTSGTFPDGWGLSTSTTPPTIATGSASQFVKETAAGVKISGNTTLRLSNNKQYFYRDITVVSGATYRFGLTARLLDAPGASGGTLTTGTMNVYAYPVTSGTQGAEYNHLLFNSGTNASKTFEFTATSTTVRIAFNKNYTITTQAYAYIDDIALQKKSQVTALTITPPTIASKVYDGNNTSGTITSGTLSGFNGSETVTVSAAVGTYADANVGTGKTATIVYTLADGTNGGLAANYTLANGTATGDITPATPTVSIYGSNLVNNGDFETSGWADGIAAIPPSWSAASSANIYKEPVSGYYGISGTQSVRLGSAGSYVAIYQDVVLEAGQTYRYGCTGRLLDAAGASGGTLTGTPTLTMEVREVIGGTPSASVLKFFSFSSNTNHTQTDEFTVGSNTTIRLTLYKSTKIVYIDDVFLLKKNGTGSFVYSGFPQSLQAFNTGTSTSYSFSYTGTNGTSYGPITTAPTNVGSYTTTATVLANGNYGSATSSSSAFSITKATPTLTVSNTPVTYDGTAHSATASASEGGVVTNISTGGAPNQTNAGIYSVTADIAASTNYNAATGVTATNSFVIDKASQTITFGALPTGKTIGESDFAPAATSATSGVNVISYSTSDATVASISGIGQIHIVGVGTCTIYADQASSTNYNAATQQSQSLTIAARPLIILGINATSADLTNPVADISVPANADLTIGADRTIHNISIERGGKVTLNDGYSLIVNDININSDANGTGTFVDKNATNAHGLTVNGTSTVQQYVTSTAKGVTGRNWYVSSPVSAAVSSTITTATTNDLVSYNETTGGWDNAGSTMGIMKGYIAISPAQNTTLVFSGGSLNTGSQSVSNLSYAGATKKGFNLIGNPYPSYLDWDLGTVSNVLTSVWYRSKSTGAYLFQTYNTLGGLPTATNGGTNLIPPMQAFWVRATSATNSVSFDNTMRSHQDQTVATNRLKSPSKANALQQVLRLAVSNGVNTDETVLYSNPNALNGADNYDSPKMTNANIAIPELYTLVEGEQMVINGLNTIPYDTEIPLGFTTGQTNSFTIKASLISNFDAGTQILLKDYQDINNPVTTDLSDGSNYTFTSDATSNNTNRFTLTFRAPSVSTGINPENNNNIWISTHDGQLVVNGNSNSETIVSVYNAIGQKIASQRMTESTKALNTKLATGVYMVAVSNAGKNITKKIIID